MRGRRTAAVLARRSRVGPGSESLLHQHEAKRREWGQPFPADGLALLIGGSISPEVLAYSGGTFGGVGTVPNKVMVAI